MARTFIRQDAQISSTLHTEVGFLDNIAPTLANYETNATDAAYDLNCLRSQIQNILNRDGASFPSGKWYDNVGLPSTFEGGSRRGVSKVNQDLHDFEHKRIIRCVQSLVDITVPAAVRATGSLTSGASTNFSAADTVSIDEVAGVTYKVYTFTSPVGANDGDVLLGATLQDSLDNLKAAINLETPIAGRYAAATTLHPLVECTSSAAETLSVRAKAYGTQGNLIRTDCSVADPDWAAAALSGGAGDLVILGAGELPSVLTAAVGGPTTQLGTIVAYNATFGKATLDEVSGSTNISPKNLGLIVDADTRDPIILPDPDGRQVWALFQSESSTQGHTISDLAGTRVQWVFVVLNAEGNDLELVTSNYMGGKSINYCFNERTYLLSLNEQDFLRGAAIDIGGGAVAVTRQNAYDNQGATPVDVSGYNAILDIESTGNYWVIRDEDENDMLKLTTNSGTNATTVEVGSNVDYLDVNAADVDFASGITVRSGGARDIDVGVNDGVIETTAGALEVQATTTLSFDDGNKPGGWSLVEGVHLSDSGAEWTAFEAAFGGEVSLLNAITQAFTKQKRVKVQATLTADVLATNDVNGPGTAHNNTDVDLLPFDTVPTSFVQDVEVYLNGELLRNAAGATEDVYPGGTPSAGDLKFTFNLKGTGTKPDQLTVIVNGQI